MRKAEIDFRLVELIDLIENNSAGKSPIEFSVEDCLSYLKTCIVSMLHDLESTRRERNGLLKKLRKLGE